MFSNDDYKKEKTGGDINKQVLEIINVGRKGV